MQGAILHDTGAGLKTRPRTTVYYSNSASQLRIAGDERHEMCYYIKSAG